MSHKTQMIADAAVFINISEFADAIYYNGAKRSINAIVEVEENLANGNTFSNQGSAARAIVHVAATSIPSPAANATILHNSMTWRIARILDSDNAMHRLECVATESAF